MSPTVETLILTASDVTACLDPESCRQAIGRAFVLLAEGRAPAPRLLGFESENGSFHIKAARFPAERPSFVAKINGNFPGNPARNGLPTIQGVLVLADASDGRPLAVIDSGAITAIRTAAASALATEHLAMRDAQVAAIVGCGLQGAAHADALLALRPFHEIRLFDVDRARAESLATRLVSVANLSVRVADSARAAALGAPIVVTCTTGAAYVLGAEDLSPGTFVAAVGTDNPHKREIHPSLMSRSRVVADDLAQCVSGGDLHHAIAAGVMRAEDVHAELAAVVAGTRPGRERDDDVFVFDSTGIALEDAAAAEIVEQRARALGLGRTVNLGA
jgi:alanine dehydrogenase